MGDGVADYTLEGVKWGAPAFGGSGGTVTWAYDSSVPSAFVASIATAFATWSAYGNIAFQQVGSTNAAQIDLHVAGIDGPNATLGEAGFVYSGTTIQSADITFDSGEGWHVSGSSVTSASGVDLMLVALHEIGHAIGLDHYDGALAAMNTYLNPSLTGLTGSDIHGIQAIYGATATAQVAADGTHPVFRFFDTATGHHFYTTNAAEKAAILATNRAFNYEGALWATPDRGAETVDVFRFFDKRNGDHFYTSNAAERDSIVSHLPSFQYEGVAFQAYARAGAPGTVQLERFFNTATGEHHLSANAGETAGIKAGLAGPSWVDEGASFVVHAASADTLLA